MRASCENKQTNKNTESKNLNSISGYSLRQTNVLGVFKDYISFNLYKILCGRYDSVQFIDEEL